MSRVELFERIRRDHRDEDLSIHSLAGRYRVHRRVVRQALRNAVPPQRKRPVREAPVLGPYKEVIREWLRADYDRENPVPKKQRHTARRVWRRLVVEHGAAVSEGTVRRFVREVKADLANVVSDVMVPQTHALGAEAEVDFGEFQVVLAGVLTTVYMFVLRLSASGAGFHVAFTNQAQEVFLEGHRLAFEHFGALPGRIRYDNLKAAVVKVMRGRNRQETERFVALRSHYGYESFYCAPGRDGAHEKGGVEGEIGRFRRNHLVPVPRVESMAELNRLIAAADLADGARHIDGRAETVAEAFAQEVPHLMALPAEAFDTARELSCRVDAKARIAVRQSFYSVPVHLVGRRLRVRLGADFVEAVVDGAVVACHERALGKGSEVLVLDITLRRWPVSPARSPGPSRWSRPARAGRSPRPTTSSGGRRGAVSVTATAPGH